MVLYLQKVRLEAGKQKMLYITPNDPMMMRFLQVLLQNTTNTAEYALYRGLSVSDFLVEFEGGNFLANGNGICIIANKTFSDNAASGEFQYVMYLISLESQLRSLFKDALGCTQLIALQTLEDCATGHVDMYISWANSTTLIVGQYSAQQDPINSEIIENNVEKLKNLTDPASGAFLTSLITQGLPIKILRMPMPSSCPDVVECQYQSIYPCCDSDPTAYKGCSGTCLTGSLLKYLVDFGLCNEIGIFTCSTW